MKKFVISCSVFIVLYIGIVRVQIFFADRANKINPGAQVTIDETPSHKVYVFSFAKYTPTGEKEIEIEGDSANILARTVNLMNVVAKAYAEETPVTITADRGNYDKIANKIHLEKNVVATTEDGTRLLTEMLDIYPTNRMMETHVKAEVKKDNINIEGLGAVGDSHLKKVRFKKNVKVVIQDPNDESDKPTVITCDGPLEIDYQSNIAYFNDNVIARDHRGTLYGDKMDVYYDRDTRKVAKIHAMGNVVVEDPDGNKTFSDTVTYYADDGRVIFGGDAEVLYYEGGQRMDDDFFDWSSSSDSAQDSTSKQGLNY